MESICCDVFENILECMAACCCCYWWVAMRYETPEQIPESNKKVKPEKGPESKKAPVTEQNIKMDDQPKIRQNSVDYTSTNSVFKKTDETATPESVDIYWTDRIS